MLWCQGAQNIGLSKAESGKSTLSDHNVRPFQTDRQTNGQSGTDGSRRTSWQQGEDSF